MSDNIHVRKESTTYKDCDVCMVTRNIVVGKIIHHLAACEAIEPVVRVSTSSNNGTPNSHYREQSNKAEAAQSAVE